VQNFLRLLLLLIYLRFISSAVIVLLYQFCVLIYHRFISSASMILLIYRCISLAPFASMILLIYRAEGGAAALVGTKSNNPPVIVAIISRLLYNFILYSQVH